MGPTGSVGWQWQISGSSSIQRIRWARCWSFIVVLGSARTGLIFTRLQEGAQPGGLTPPGQTEPGIPYHVPSRWVPVGGAARWELTRGLGARGAGPVRESGCLGRAVCRCVFSLSVLLFVAVPFVCCSVKLPLSRSTGFYLFLFILLHMLAGGGAATWHFCCRRQPKPRHLIWRPSVGQG